MRRARFHGFSLLEVVFAVALFAVGVVASLALFTPLAGTAARSAEADTAARVADSVLTRLRVLPFATVESELVQDAEAVQANDAKGAYNPNDGSNPAVLFARADGEVGVFDPTNSQWRDSRGAVLANADKFFEIDLVRQTALTPKAPAEPAAAVAFVMRIRWPAFRTTGGANFQQIGAGATGNVTFDRGRQQVLFVHASLAR